MPRFGWRFSFISSKHSGWSHCEAQNGTMLSQGKIGVALAILSMCGLGHTEENITSDTHFYGQSEPVYPSRTWNKHTYRLTKLIYYKAKGKGTGDWADAYAKAAELVAQLTLEEKVCLLPEPRVNVVKANKTRRIILPMESQQPKMVALEIFQLSPEWDLLECVFKTLVREFVLPILLTATPVVSMSERGKRNRS